MMFLLGQYLIIWCKQEDFEYLWKLVAASVASAVVLKCGSAVFPGITRSNTL